MAQHRLYQTILRPNVQVPILVSGDVHMDIVGKQDGEEQVVLSLTELGFTSTYPLKFKYRYFQDLTGTFALPAGFVPDRVLVTARQNGKDAVQASFPWPETSVP